MSNLGSFDRKTPSDDVLREMSVKQMNGRVGQELISETEDVRIWRISLKPGERVGFHRHQLNYFWVAINAGRSRSQMSSGETVETEYEAGDCRFYAFGANEFMLHDLTNIGETELVFTTVEMKKSTNPPLPL